MRAWCPLLQQRAHNHEAAAMLESLAGMYKLAAGEGSGWRERGFNRAAAVLRGIDKEITDVGQLRVRSQARPRCTCLASVLCYLRGTIVHRTYGIHTNLYI